MTALPELAFESTTTLTQEEFFLWATARTSWDLNRYELLNGRVIMTPPAGDPHGRIEAALVVLVGSFVRDHRLGVCLGSSQGIELPSGDTVAPDLSIVSQRRWTAMGSPVAGRFLPVVPDLAVEILSPATASKDRGKKRVAYERNGVREYWLVDPKAGTLLVFRRRAGRFDGGRVYRRGQPFRSTVLRGLAFDVADVLPPES